MNTLDTLKYTIILYMTKYLFGWVKFVHVRFENQLPNMFTKPLHTNWLSLLLSKMAIKDIYNPSWESFREPSRDPLHTITLYHAKGNLGEMNKQFLFIPSPFLSNVQELPADHNRTRSGLWTPPSYGNRHGIITDGLNIPYYHVMHDASRKLSR